MHSHVSRGPHPLWCVPVGSIRQVERVVEVEPFLLAGLFGSRLAVTVMVQHLGLLGTLCSAGKENYFLVVLFFFSQKKKNSLGESGEQLRTAAACRFQKQNTTFRSSGH